MKTKAKKLYKQLTLKEAECFKHTCSFKIRINLPVSDKLVEAL